MYNGCHHKSKSASFQIEYLPSFGSYKRIGSVFSMPVFSDQAASCLDGSSLYSFSVFFFEVLHNLIKVILQKIKVGE